MPLVHSWLKTNLLVNWLPKQLNLVRLTKLRRFKIRGKITGLKGSFFFKKGFFINFLKSFINLTWEIKAYGQRWNH